ncbi:helix-turn-helix domain-containing protein [Ilumatobacter sp.]|uniref:helix-turn-helix domain-containing protein n=1 Tax=Ilumatobacter sp. TaxID=1967498 RepID=UPI003C5CEC97
MDPDDTTDPIAHAHVADPTNGQDDLAQFFAEQNDTDGSETLDDERHIGARLAEARSAAGFTQREIADRIGVKESTIAKWETGDTSPRGHRVSKLAGVLGVSISWILMGRGVEPNGGGSDIERIRADLDSVRARLDDVVNELAVLDQRLASVDD